MAGFRVYGLRVKFGALGVRSFKDCEFTSAGFCLFELLEFRV